MGARNQHVKDHTVKDLGSPFKHFNAIALILTCWKGVPIERHQGIELYQQPDGIEDSILTSWKIRRQAEVAPISIGLRDMSTGVQSELVKYTAMSKNQMLSFTGGKASALLVTDTDIAVRVKAAVKRRQKYFHQETHALAKAHDMQPRPSLFNCTT